MRRLFLLNAFPAALFLVGAGSLYALYHPAEAVRVRPRVPGDDAKPAAASLQAETPFQEQAELELGDGVPAAPGEDWPCFRGAARDNLYRGAGLSPDWPDKGPPRLWELELGEGYAGAAVSSGRAYVLDYDQDRERDALRCLSLTDGKEIWRLSYPVAVKRNHGMSRTVPAVADGYVVALGPKCHVVCASAETGDLAWGIDLAREYGAEVPQWYAGQCPLLDRGRAILAPGGPECLLLAVNLADGKIAWKMPNPEGWPMSHASLAVAEIGGRRMYVYFSTKGAAGFDAEDGRRLWSSTAIKVHTAVPTPLPLPGDRIFVTAGYQKGCAMLKIQKNVDGYFSARTLFTVEAQTFGSEQQTPVFYDGYLYGVVGGQMEGELVCLDQEGKRRWSSGAVKYGLGPYLVAGGVIYIMDNTGTLSAVEATPEAFRPLRSAKVLDGHDSWGPMAPAGGMLIVRDFTRMVCLDLRKQP